MASIVVFDGECVLCSANARFILKHDKRHHFMLAAMQGDYGRKLYQDNGIDPTEPETLIVVQNDRVVRNSDAVLTIYSGLGWPWKIAGILKIVPQRLRDAIYLLVARNRYKIFGKRETCWVPKPEFQNRIL